MLELGERQKRQDPMTDEQILEMNRKNVEVDNRRWDKDGVNAEAFIKEGEEHVRLAHSEISRQQAVACPWLSKYADMDKGISGSASRLYDFYKGYIAAPGTHKPSVCVHSERDIGQRNAKMAKMVQRMTDDGTVVCCLDFLSQGELLAQERLGKAAAALTHRALQADFLVVFNAYEWTFGIPNKQQSEALGDLIVRRAQSGKPMGLTTPARSQEAFYKMMPPVVARHCDELLNVDGSVVVE